MSSFKHPTEIIACEYLQKQGHIILEHNKLFCIDNFKVEIDIISYEERKEILHFVEVKNWKASLQFIHPVIRERIKRKDKMIASYKKFIEDVYKNIHTFNNKVEYNSFLCLLQTKNLWEISISFDLIWIQEDSIEFFTNILFDI